MSLWGRVKAAYRSLTRQQFEELGILGPPDATGVHVNQSTANNVAAYWNGICVIAGDLGVIDRHIYRRADRERATSLPAYKVVVEQPNPETTPMQFWETISGHAVGWGNGYAEIEFDRAMRPLALWPLTPDRVRAEVENVTDGRGVKTSRKFYIVDGRTRLEAEDVFHVAGLGYDGIRGYSPVYLGRQSLGLSMAAERFGAAFFGNGAYPGIALQHPGTLGEKAQENLKRSWLEKAGGAKAHSPMILEEGMTVSKPISIPPDDAQFLETRQFQIEEIARWLNLPPHKLKHKVNERPGGNFEASELDYQVTTLLPWATRIEQEIDRKLISPSQRGQFYAEHNFKKRLMTDTNTRMATYKTLFGMHVIDAEQIARFENLPVPKPKPEPEPPTPPPAPAHEPAHEPAEGDRAAAVRRAQEALLLAEVARFMRREAEQAKRAAAKGPAGFSKWLDTFYGAGEEVVLAGSLAPAVRVCAIQAGSPVDHEAVAGGFARGYLARSKAALQELKTTDLPAGVQTLVKKWETARAVESVAELMAAATVKEERHVA